MGSKLTKLQLVPAASAKVLREDWESLRSEIESGEYSAFGFIGVRPDGGVTTLTSVASNANAKHQLVSGTVILQRRILGD